MTLDYPQVYERLENGHVLVTGNSRLSRVIAGQYGQWRVNRGDELWPRPSIFSWNSWLESLWETAGLFGLPGTDAAVPGHRQLISLWEDVLRRDALSGYLLHPESLAGQLNDTLKAITEWKVDISDPAWSGDKNENHAAFLQWKSAFARRCQRDNWITPEDRGVLLVEAVRSSPDLFTACIDLLGFDQFSPGQADLLMALAESGTGICRLNIKSRQDKAYLWQSRDPKHELQKMARWVRYWSEKDPGCSIAVVVPDLQSRREVVERQLTDILSPTKHAGQSENPWNISMGMPLSRLPMIESAFDLLKLFRYRIDIQDVGRVLRSPWIRGGVSERNPRALLEKCLRANYPRQLKLSELQYRAAEIKQHDCQNQPLAPSEHKPRAWNSPELSGILKQLENFSSDFQGYAPPSAWAERIDRLLASLGWPLAGESEDGLASMVEDHDSNWQTLQAWRDALRDLASLDVTRTKISRKDAIYQLQLICRERIFQPHTSAAAIQVLGVYEASGLRFDHLWVMGLHIDNWPGNARPNPFIPGRLQVLADMPHSSPGRELEIARIVTRRLLETAPDCVFSYPGQLEGESVFPSPLLDLEEIVVTEQVPGWQGDNWQTRIAAAGKPRLYPLLMPAELGDREARGGSSILKHQALCPFSAFASNRLAADGLESPVDGISPMLHGSLLHGVLELFWKQTRSRLALEHLSVDILSERVRRCVEEVVQGERGLQQRPAFQGVEADRLYRLVLAYLRLELERDDFEVVAFEKEIQPDIGGRNVRLIIDRVDKLSTGEEIIMDYKSGKVEPKNWFGDRPADPQLPLYAITAEKTPVAVVFAVIRDDGCAYKGVVRNTGVLPGLPPKITRLNQYLEDAGKNMPETIDNWRQILHRLMSDFLAGKASIDPRDGRKTCDNTYCDLQSLCRFGELEQGQKYGSEQGK